jgi:fermentation-respiration switch protein FrsA (DUF1100 family)
MLEDTFIYFPTRDGIWDRERLPFAAEDCHFATTDGVRLHGWRVTVEEPLCELLYFHGNAGNVSYRVDFIERLSRLPANVTVIDYRGYGRSQGRPTEEGLYRDADAAYRFLCDECSVDPGRIVLFGKSLGGAVAIELATRVDCAGLIAQSTFTHNHDMARTMVPFAPMHLLVRRQFDSLARIAQIAIPKLLVHGRGDRLIPYEMGRRLFAAAPEPKRFFDLGSLDHNDVMLAGADYDHALADFIRACVAG